MIVEKYPANLITEDRWGALPLLYAFWGAAPAEIIDLLLESYQTLHPGHVFNWTIMVTTMGRCDTPKERIENLLRVRQIHFPEQPIDWEYLLNELAIPSNCHLSEVLFLFARRFCRAFQSLLSWSTFSRTYAISIHVRHVGACGSPCFQNLA